MLTASFHPRKNDLPKLERFGEFQWVTWGNIVIHLYPKELAQYIELQSILSKFIQESSNAQASLPNGDRLDDSRDVPLVPTESL